MIGYRKRNDALLSGTTRPTASVDQAEPDVYMLVV